MPEKTVSQRILGIIAEHFGMDEYDISEETTLHELRGDSLSAMEIILEIEDQFNINIPDEDVFDDTPTRWKNIKTIIDAAVKNGAE